MQAMNNGGRPMAQYYDVENIPEGYMMIIVAH